MTRRRLDPLRLNVATSVIDDMPDKLGSGRLGSVSLGPLIFEVNNLRLRRRRDDALIDGGVLEVDTTVLDRDFPHDPRQLTFISDKRLRPYEPPEVHLLAIRRVIIEAFVHELDEQLKLNDRRVLDPHGCRSVSVNTHWDKASDNPADGFTVAGKHKTD